MKTKIKIAFSVIFLAFPIFTFTNAVVAIGDMSAHKTGSAAVYLLAAVAVFAALVGVYAVLKRIANGKKISKIITPDLVFTVCSIAMLAIQIYLIVRLDYKPVHDAYYVDAAARNFARDGNFADMYAGLHGKENYFTRFTNNWGILLLLSYFYRSIYLIFGTVPSFAAQVLNIILLQFSVFMTFMTAKLVLKDKGTQMFAAIFSAILPPIYLYTPIFYTDTLSMPFVISALYCFIRGTRAQKNGALFGWMAGAAVITGVGYTLKGSLCVLLAAEVIYCFFRLRPLKAAGVSAMFVAALLVCNSTVFNIGLAQGISTREMLKRHRIPTIHWVMMSAVNEGGFNKEEFRYTIHYEGYEEKKAADLERLEQHIKDYTPRTFIDHLVEKSNFTWAHGKYFSRHHLQETSRTPLKYMLTSGRGFDVFCQAMQLSMLALMSISFIYGVRKRRVTPMFMVQMAVFGLAFFLLIWETRSRYLINFLPLFILMSAHGARITAAWLSKIFKCIHPA